MRNLPLKALLLLLPFLFVNGLAQQRLFLESGAGRWADQGLLLPSPTRTIIDLGGNWRFSVLDGPTGTVRLPAAFDFAGTVSFDRTIDIGPELLDKYQFHLVMLGVHHATEVSINSEFVLNHTGGYTGVSQPLNPNLLLPGGGNSIHLTVNNLLDAKKTLPLRPHVWEWRNYGGVHREVFLLGTPKFYIRDVAVSTSIVDNPPLARVAARVTVDGTLPMSPVDQGGDQVTVVVELMDQTSGAQLAQSAPVPMPRRGDEWSDATAELAVSNPKIWRPDSPELYLLKCTLFRGGQVLDEYAQAIGLRSFTISRGDLMLNGRRVILKGVTWNEDHPLSGNALTPEEREKDIVLIKNLGANLIRFSNHPPHPVMLSLCDRYGLLAMVEIPVVGTPGAVLADEAYQEQASTILLETVRRDRNHPSVIAWGIGDEFESSHPGARAYVQALVAVGRSVDTRPIYFGSRTTTSDICTDLTDIAALNVHAEDLKSFRADLEQWRARYGRKPLVISRFGQEVQHENRNGTSDPFSQQAQARFYLQRFEVARTLDYDGGVVWSFNDWRGDRPSLTVHSGDPWMHTNGLVSATREKRIAYDAVRALFSGDKFVALPAGTYNPNAPIVYVVAGFLVLVAIAYLYNRTRRFRDNLNRSVLNAYNFFSDIRDQHVVSNLHSVFLALIVAVALAIVLSSLLFHFRESWVLDSLLSVLLVTDSLKAWLVRLIWNPVLFIAYFSVMLFLGLFILAGLVLLLRWVFKTRIYPFHAFSVTVWSTPPLLVLIPVGMILYRVLESPFYVYPALGLLVVLHLWVAVRWLQGIAIVFDVSPVKVYLLGSCAMLAVLGFAYVYYDVTQAAPLYLSMLVDAARGAR